MSRCRQPMDLSAVDDALGKLIAAQIAFGKAALTLASDAGGLLDKLGIPQTSSCCDIPDPCWMPKSVGEICCSIATDDVGEVCLLVTNEDFVAHEYRVHAAGEHGGMVQINQPNFTLGPKERKMVSARFKMPPENPDSQNIESCCLCNDFEAVLWVTGCHNYYLNWYLNRSDECRECCHEVDVLDTPNYELHWYDHFHIYRPCIGQIKSTTTTPVTTRPTTGVPRKSKKKTP